MKLLDKFYVDDKKIHRKQVYDIEPTLNEAKELRDQIGQKDVLTDSKLVGRVPMWLYARWLKEARVDWSDKEGCKRVLRSKMMDGDFAKLRVWQGAF